MFGHTQRSDGALSVHVIDAQPVDTTYRVVETLVPREPVQASPYRNGLSQFCIEFGAAVFGLVGGLFRAVVGLGMPIGVLAAIGFLILYGFIKVPSCLYWAAGSAGLAFASFTACYLSGMVQAGVDRFVARGRG